MANYILTIFKHYLPIIFSWGFNTPIAIENGLRFNVQGYLHKGKVEVIYNEGEDLFRVRLLKPNGDVIRVEEGVYLDCLVEVIDGLVERTRDYSTRVRRTYGL